MNEPSNRRWGFSEGVIGIGILIFVMGVFPLGDWLLTPKTRLAVVSDLPKANLGRDGKSWIDTLTPEQIAKLSYWDIEGK